MKETIVTQTFFLPKIAATFPIYYLEDLPFSYMRKDGSFGDFSPMDTRFFSDLSKARMCSNNKYHVCTTSIKIEDSEEGRKIGSAEEALKHFQTT